MLLSGIAGGIGVVGGGVKQGGLSCRGGGLPSCSVVGETWWCILNQCFSVCRWRRGSVVTSRTSSPSRRARKWPRSLYRAPRHHPHHNRGRLWTGGREKIQQNFQQKHAAAAISQRPTWMVFWAPPSGATWNCTVLSWRSGGCQWVQTPPTPVLTLQTLTSFCCFLTFFGGMWGETSSFYSLSWAQSDKHRCCQTCCKQTCWLVQTHKGVPITAYREVLQFSTPNCFTFIIRVYYRNSVAWESRLLYTVFSFQVVFVYNLSDQLMFDYSWLESHFQTVAHPSIHPSSWQNASD